jgi:SAM-dependent methyltransferase|tara:strand:+ start:190 stop:747 length:558 start_codon:yes stop_codon:yes gene_type:complete
MHHEVLHFVWEKKYLFPQHFNNSRVLEIGSRSVTDQPTIRCHFQDCDYTGVDISDGLYVDVVSKGHEFKSDKLFDTAISCECFEHDPFYKKTIMNMIDNLRPKGLLIFTCASTGRSEHGTRKSSPESSIEGLHPEDFEYDMFQDYYKNLVADDFKSIPGFNDKMFGQYWVSNEGSSDLYFYGFKR